MVDILDAVYRTGKSKKAKVAETAADYAIDLSNPKEALQHIDKLEKAMHTAAKDLEFEKAAAIRDQITELRARI